MNKRKAVIGGVAIAGVIAVIGVMWVVKNGKPDEDFGSATQSVAPVPADAPVEKTPDTPGTTAAPARSALLDGPLNLTGPFDLAEYRAVGVPVIIDFGADSCIPCKEMAPVLVALHDELKGKAIIRFVDVWKYRDLAEGIPLQVIPTQVFFDASGKPFTPSDKLQIPMTQYSTRETNEHVFTTHEGGITKDQLLSVLNEMGMQK